MTTESKPARPAEAIILAGGLGTRLRSMSGDLPKPMVPVGDRPFLAWLLEKLHSAGVQRTVLAVGYRHDVIRDHFGSDFRGMALDYAVETTPLGTGGALAAALGKTSADDLLVLNGDSYYGIDINALFSYHVRMRGDVTIALKHLANCTRYGTVTVDGQRIVAFREKGHTGSGEINGGIYVVNRRLATELPTDRAYSFEQDVLARSLTHRTVLAYHCDGYFIDIGTPEDYRRAGQELPAIMGTRS